MSIAFLIQIDPGSTGTGKHDARLPAVIRRAQSYPFSPKLGLPRYELKQESSALSGKKESLAHPAMTNPAEEPPGEDGSQNITLQPIRRPTAQGRHFLA